MEDHQKDSIPNEADYPHRVVFPSEEALVAKGFGRVAGLPFIFDHRPRYHRVANQFLLDLGLGEWNVTTRGRESNANVPPPSSATMRDYAHWLCNYLQYCHSRGKDPLAVDYVIDLIQGYQQEMLSGVWSRDKRPLAAKTANCRVGTACTFLFWAADKGLREKFSVPTVRRTVPATNARGSGAAATKDIEARKGKARENKRRLGLPDEKLIGNWLRRLTSKNSTEGLIAETILETAVRRAEAAGWRVDTLPLDTREWNVVNGDRPIEHQSVLVTLRYGTKGAQYGKDHGDKIGPSGTIHVPMPLALKLHNYRSKVRPKAISTLLKAANNSREAEKLRAEAVHLFLNPETGKPYTGQQIYDFWTASDVGCPKGWHPHLGRDFWACSQLWRHLAEHRDLLDKISRADVDPAILRLLSLDLEGFIERSIKPQLRHASQETTYLYLQWVSDKLNVNLNLGERYMAQVDDQDPERVGN